MPTIRLRSQLSARAVRALDAYVRSADKAAAVRMSDALLSPRSAADEMAVLARMGRTRFPLWHFVLSWPLEDTIDTTTGLDTAAQLVRALDLDGTQWIAAAHGDAAHRHVHLMINRVDPHTHRTRAPQRIAQQIIAFRAQLEQNGEHSPRVSRDAMKLPARALDAEIWNGDITFMRWLRGELAKSRPTSWPELDSQLGALGVVRQARRGGFVFIERTGTRSYGVRASMVGFGPSVLRKWGPSPAAPGPSVRERLSYAELLALGALRSPMVPAHLERLRDRWVHERQHRPGTVAQFGKWLRRQVSGSAVPNDGPLKGRLHSMIKDESNGAPDNLIRDGALILGAPTQDNAVHPGATKPTPQVGTGSPIPLSPQAIDALYGSLRDEHEKIVLARMSNDDVLSSRVRGFSLQRTALQSSARQHADAAGDAQDAQARLKAAMALAGTLANVARAQERTAIELVPYRAQLDALELQSFNEFLKSRPDVTPELRAQLRTIAQADPHDQRREVFVYNDALSSLVNLGMDRDGDDLLYYASPPAIALQDRKAPDLQLLFRESNDGLTLARTPTSQAIDAALVVAAARWNNCINLSGDDAFVEVALRRAVELGIGVTNPELQARLEALRTRSHEQRQTLQDRPLLLPPWLPAQVIIGTPGTHSINPSEQRLADICAAVRASAFGAGACETVDVRSLPVGQVNAVYATTLQTGDGPVIAGCDSQRRILVAALKESEDLRNAAIAYQGAINITTGPTPEVSIASTRAVEQARKREPVGGRSL